MILHGPSQKKTKANKLHRKYHLTLMALHQKKKNTTKNKPRNEGFPGISASAAYLPVLGEQQKGHHVGDHQTGAVSEVCMGRERERERERAERVRGRVGNRGSGKEGKKACSCKCTV